MVANDIISELYSWMLNIYYLKMRDKQLCLIKLKEAFAVGEKLQNRRKNL